MKFLIFILVITSVVFLQSTDAYHPEREVTLEKSQRTGIFNSMMDRITFPVVGESYHLQVVLRDELQYKNSTVNVGFGFNHLDRVPNKLTPDSDKPFMGFESQHSTSAMRDSQTIQTSQHSFPIIVNFTVSFERPGVHHYSFFNYVIGPEGSGGSSSGGGYHVVSQYSKAIGEDGRCKNSELLTLAKHDFSTLVCVTQETRHELITRGWGPLP